MKSEAAYSLEDALERVFGRKRDAFVDDYGLKSKPALLWQCMPREELAIDATNDAVRSALEEGASTISDSAWWYGFKAGRRSVLVFEGLASTTKADASGWATEVHADGHMMAGVWTFPEVTTADQRSQPAVADFYLEAFRDFGFVATRVYEAASYSGGVALTCTMMNADQLPLAGNRDRILAPPVNRAALRWPVLGIDGPEQAHAACSAMATQFMRAYGRVAPKP